MCVYIYIYIYYSFINLYIAEAPVFQPTSSALPAEMTSLVADIMQLLILSLSLSLSIYIYIVCIYIYIYIYICRWPRPRRRWRRARSSTACGCRIKHTSTIIIIITSSSSSSSMKYTCKEGTPDSPTRIVARVAKSTRPPTARGVLHAAKSALLDAAAGSESTYVLGYGTPNPFKDRARSHRAPAV